MSRIHGKFQTAITLLALLALSCRPEPEGGHRARSNISSSLSGETDIGSGGENEAARDYMDLESLSLSELQDMYRDRAKQDEADEQDLAVIDQMNIGLCAQLERLRSRCNVASRILPDGYARLKCGSTGGADVSSESMPKFTASVESSDPGPFILVLNGRFKSSAFPGGGEETVVTFSGGSMSDAKLAPQFKQIYRAEIRRAKEDPEKMAQQRKKADEGGSNPSSADESKTKKPAAKSSDDPLKLPKLDEFSFTFKVNDEEVFSGLPLTYDDSSYQGYRYLLNLYLIEKKFNSSECRLSHAHINSIKDSIREAVEETFRKEDYKKTRGSNVMIPDINSKPDLMGAIDKLKSSIEKRSLVLEDERNRLLRITTELSPDEKIGCHAMEEIKTINIEVAGAMFDDKDSPLVMTRARTRFENKGLAASLIRFRLGSNVVISIDQSQTQLIGSHYETSLSEETLVGAIEYLQIEKLGTQFSNSPVQTSGILGFGGKDYFDIREEWIYSITGVRIFVNTYKVYDNQNLNLTFSSANYTPGGKPGIMKWTAKSFRANPDWVKLMQRTDCEQTH